MLDPIIAFFSKIFEWIGRAVGTFVAWLLWPFLAFGRWYNRRGWIIKAPVVIVVLALVVGYGHYFYATQFWHGFNPALAMSIVALVGGVAVYAMRGPLIDWHERTIERIDARAYYQWFEGHLFRAAEGLDNMLHRPALQPMVGVLTLAACAVEPPPAAEPSLVDPTGFVTYRHPTGAFSLSLPPDWVVSDTSDAYALNVGFSTTVALFACRQARIGSWVGPRPLGYCSVRSTGARNTSASWRRRTEPSITNRGRCTMSISLPCSKAA